MTVSLRLFDGRGRWHRWDAKSTTADFLRLDAHQIGRMGLDWRHRFTWRWSWSTWLGGEHVATITYTNTGPGAWGYDVSVPGAEVTGGTPGTAATAAACGPSSDNGRFRWVRTSRSTWVIDSVPMAAAMSISSPTSTP